MDGVKTRLYICIGAFSACLILLAITAFRRMVISYILAVVLTALLILLVNAAANYRAVRLIIENKLHDVRCVSVSEAHGDGLSRPRASVEVIISGFGIIVGHSVYKFGRDGVRLVSMEIGCEHLNVFFGNAEKQQSITLLHGFACEEAARDFSAAVAYETGVIPELVGWEGDEA